MSKEKEGKAGKEGRKEQEYTRMMVRISGILAWNHPVKDIIRAILREPEAHTCEDIRRRNAGTSQKCLLLIVYICEEFCHNTTTPEVKCALLKLTNKYLII